MTVFSSFIKTVFKFCFITFCFVMMATACRNKQTGGEVKQAPPPSGIQTEDTSASVSASKILPDSFENKLIGKWIRSDGGYTIEVFSATKDGKLDAGYFNPNPIHVDKSEWKISENILYMRVILKDINYPGSTYVLRYIPDNETLAGNYFQAVEKTNYDVIFSRKK
jgi:hypothetical protein